MYLELEERGKQRLDGVGTLMRSCRTAKVTGMVPRSRVAGADIDYSPDSVLRSRIGVGADTDVGVGVVASHKDCVFDAAGMAVDDTSEESRLEEDSVSIYSCNPDRQIESRVRSV